MLSILVAFGIVSATSPARNLAQGQGDEVKFKKIVLDKRFVAEGVAVGDVNNDHALDVMAGNVWYEAPDWTPHEIAPFVEVDPKTAYSNCFNSWAVDVNHDRWVDQIVIGMPGEKAVWRENPGNTGLPWKEHLIWHSACNESPLCVDILRRGEIALIMGTDDTYLAWFEPAKDPNAEWICHPISDLKGAGSQRYSHGLGYEEVNQGGEKEVLTKDGYFVQPQDPRQSPWTFVKAELGPECAQMLAFEWKGGKKPGILTTSAHGRGVWWHQPLEDGSYERHLIDESVSETHAAVVARLNTSSGLNLITGKRKWAHPPGVDVGSDEPSLLVRYELQDTSDGVVWIRHVIDEDSGVGTQFVVRDINRDSLSDIVIANKNGVFLFLQE